MELSRRRLDVIIAAQSGVGKRRMLFTNATHAFSSSWLLADWSGAEGITTLERMRPCLKILYEEFTSLLWGDRACCLPV